jgi:GT2 family glycosyltransferase
MLTVVLHYGDPALTRRAVRALTRDGSRVQVIDNAAPMPYTETNWRLPRNIFWAGGLEAALAGAREQGEAYVWFCNNDIRFAGDLPYIDLVEARIGRLVAQWGRLGLYAPCVRRNPYHAQMVRRPGIAYSRVAYIDGIAPVVSLECVDAVGGLDAGDNMRGYGVDVWLSLRASSMGWPVVVDHGLEVFHDYHTTAARIPGFLDAAAADEQRYMSARMGHTWRNVLAVLQQQRQDEATW